MHFIKPGNRSALNCTAENLVRAAWGSNQSGPQGGGSKIEEAGFSDVIERVRVKTTEEEIQPIVNNSVYFSVTDAIVSNMENKRTC